MRPSFIASVKQLGSNCLFVTEEGISCVIGTLETIEKEIYIYKLPLNLLLEIYQSVCYIQMACFSLSLCKACGGSPFMKTMK